MINNCYLWILVIFVAFLFKNIICLKSSESILDLLDVNKFPASENNLSDDVDVTGMAKNILAILASTGYLIFLLTTN